VFEQEERLGERERERERRERENKYRRENKKDLLAKKKIKRNC
jgi:hypothetical protein